MLSRRPGAVSLLTDLAIACSGGFKSWRISEFSQQRGLPGRSPLEGEVAGEDRGGVLVTLADQIVRVRRP